MQQIKPELLSFESFADFFDALMSASGKRDESGNLCQMYYEMLIPLKPSDAEVWDCIQEWLNHKGTQFPSGNELKEIIREHRKSSQAYLPPAKTDKPMYPSDLAGELSGKQLDHARECRISFLKGVYKHGGDSKLYRAFLEGRLEGRDAIYKGLLADLTVTVTHEDVMESLKEGKREPAKHF